MKEQIKVEDIRKFKRDSMVYALLLAGTILLPLPLLKALKELGICLWLGWYGITIYWAFRVEKQQKAHEIFTYREILAFLGGTRLDELQMQREIGKRPYQRFLFALVLFLLGLAVVFFLRWLLFFK